MAASKKEIVVRSRLGERKVNAERLLNFPRGLIGFENQFEFVLLQIKEESAFMILQSTHDVQLGLMVTDPFLFVDKYELKIGEAEQRILRVDTIRELAVLVTVSIPKGNPQDTTLNLAGPILINSSRRIGLQVPQVDINYPSHFRLGDQEKV
jgi:flagellar assembly factor FliW